MKDLLDLCRLNLMEENLATSSAVDRDETLDILDFKKRQLVGRIAADVEPATREVLEKHLDRQVSDD